MFYLTLFSFFYLAVNYLGTLIFVTFNSEATSRSTVYKSVG